MFVAASTVIFAPHVAEALTSQTTFQVTANVVAACSVSASTLGFGAYDPAAGSPNDSGTALQVTCTTGAAYTIGLNAGTGTGATVAARKMTLSSNTLDYSLYQDSGRTTVWGNTPGTDTVASTGNGAQQSFGVYGRISAAQNVPAGSYSDTITVTVTF
jgi:spore coat protein U-like protein